MYKIFYYKVKKGEKNRYKKGVNGIKREREK